MRRIYVLLLLLLVIFECGCSHVGYLHDEDGLRYKLVSDKGDVDINWLFIPGGPGADSRYLLSLVNVLELPGKVGL